MFPILSTKSLQPGSYDIDSTPVAFHLPAGSSIVAYSGTIWVTQEGLLDDVVLRAGGRFAVRNTRRIVISAWRGVARMQIVAPAYATDAQLIDMARERAKHLRAEAIRNAFASVHDSLSQAIAAAAEAVQRAFEPARRAAGH
jgi:hypothetical protein